MPKPFTERERALISEQLLEQGYKLFSTYGLRKTSIEDLAHAAGISKAAFYIFHESKEALFMDVLEQAERDFRGEVLAAIELPGPSPRARLVAVLRIAFTLWKTIPILQVFTSTDYNTVARRVTIEKLQEHMRGDQEFGEELIARCRASGIPVSASSEDISQLLYALFFIVLHEDDFGPHTFSGAISIQLELIAAFCLGEITIPEQSQQSK